jgi:MFS family permease
MRPVAIAPSHSSSSSAWRGAGAAVIAGGIVMGLALGVRHVQGLFLLPVVADHGWTRATFGLAMAVQNLVWGVSQPLTGMVADRFGAARVVAAGLACYALGLLAMAFAPTPALFVAGAGGCIGLALSGTAFGAVYGALNRLVAPARRSAALGLAGAVGGFGQFAMVPAAQALIGHLGWAHALAAFAVAMLVALPLAVALRESAGADVPAAAGSGAGAGAAARSAAGPTAAGRPGAAAAAGPGAPAAAAPSMRAALREAFAHRGFWLLNLGFLACGFQLAFIATHLPAYLRDRGLQAGDAVAALALIALANTLGTYAFGLLGAAWRRKRLLAALYLLRSAAMAAFVLLPTSRASLCAFALAMGLLWLGTVPLTNGIVSQVFGVRWINTLFGFVFLGHQLGSFLGVWLGGVVFEATRSYDLVWIVAMTLGVVAAALHWAIDDREIVRPARRLAAA